MTHLQYLAQRIVSRLVVARMMLLYEQVKVQLSESLSVHKIVCIYQDSYAFELSLDEQVYLTIHIQRLKDSFG